MALVFLALIGLSGTMFADVKPPSAAVAQPEATILMEDVYYLGEFKDDLENVVVPDKINLEAASAGKLRLFGSIMTFSFKVRSDVNLYADGLLFEKSGVSDIRFFHDGTVLGIRTAGSKLENTTGERTVLFYRKAGFPKQQIASFFGMKNEGSRNK